jgi:lipopolysaccharide transport system ATP-binding protein
MPAIIKVEDLGKRYLIRHEERPRYKSLRDELANMAAAPFRSLRRRFGSTGVTSGTTSEEFWALKNVSFDLEQGDILGIIGRNGAGKSTLLKVLSRITEPTTGRVEIGGRVASLLEVGTGFHPELTGRENIFLNGAILGMNRLEIREKFDEIVAFAEVERFLDTPVKRYSSGMYVRLAFAVAAHLEPDILIVDEVLAVGDAQFQKKCIGKMAEVSKQGGRTVLFVSHNTGVIKQLCNRAILLSGGVVVMDDNTEAVVERYVTHSSDAAVPVQRPATLGQNHFTNVYMMDREGNRRSDYRFDEAIVIAVELYLDKYTDDLEISLCLWDRYKSPVFTIYENLDPYYRESGKLIRLNATIPPVFITPGSFSWQLCVNQPGVMAHDLHNDVLPFRVRETGSKFARYDGLNYGPIFAQYTIENVSR